MINVGKFALSLMLLDYHEKGKNIIKLLPRSSVDNFRSRYCNQETSYNYILSISVIIGSMDTYR